MRRSKKMAYINEKGERVLPAVMFDTLELATKVLTTDGKVGDDFYDVFRGGDDVPCCIHGIARAAVGRDTCDTFGPISDELKRVGIYESTNDCAIQELGGGSITFKRWCKKLRVVRGED